MKTRFYLLSLFFLVSVYIQAQQRITLLFTGDAMQHLAQIEDARPPSGYNYDSCFVQIKNEIQSAGLAVVNLEADFRIPVILSFVLRMLLLRLLKRPDSICF